ncbi:MAG: hypothetical protein U9Q40_10475 [Campylobacterota bacterium]|nr:hypothetical protein [Campylobacterota bacterium]
MSEQGKLLVQMQELITEILKSGSASAEQGSRLDKLEDQLHKQRCFKKSKNAEYETQGEEIAGLFFNDSYKEAIDKLYEYKISSEDFFGFVEYHFDEDEEDEQEILEKFTDSFTAGVHKDYELKCKSK